MQLVHRFFGHRDPHTQRYEQIADYQANTWPQPRRVVVKVEVAPQGSQRRYVVTNLPQPPEQLYQDFYVRLGDVPEGPIGELKDGLSAGGFCANAFEMLVAVAAYALVVLYRQACAAVEGVGDADVQTLRGRLGKVRAEVVRRSGVVRVSLPGECVHRQLWEQSLVAVRRHAERMAQVGEPPGTAQAS
jgi:hypothetical protein